MDIIKKYFYICGDIDDTLTTNFLNFYNSLNYETDEAIIYVSSDGGYYSCAQIIIDVINKSQVKTTLIASDRICSSAFILFYFSKCEIKILNGTYGMIHEISAEFEYRDNFTDENVIRKKQLKSMNDSLIKQLNCYFSKKELEMFKHGEDIFLDCKRLKHILSR